MVYLLFKVAIEIFTDRKDAVPFNCEVSGSNIVKQGHIKEKLFMKLLIHKIDLLVWNNFPG